MKNINVTIKFDTNPKVMAERGTLLWDNYEENVRTEINKGNNVFCVVYLKNKMSRTDMNIIIMELCKRLEWDGHPQIKFGSIHSEYVFFEETNNFDLISAAKYCMSV